MDRVNQEEYTNRLEDRYTISNFSNLSLIEIITLLILLRDSKPIVRHSLYLQINEFLESEKFKIKIDDYTNLSKSEQMILTFLRNKRNLSTSSFYNNLKNLEKMGLISFNFNIKGKVISIEPTSLTVVACDIISQYFIRTSLALNYGVLFENAKRVLDIIGRKKFENLLLVWLYEYADIELFNFLISISDSFFILCKKELCDNAIKNYYTNEKASNEKINFTQVYNNLIREPNDFFDLIVFSYLEAKPDYIGLDRLELLKETVRVAKKDGIIVLNNFSKLPTTEDFTTNRLIEIYNKANRHQISTEQQLIGDMRKVGLSKITVFENKGQIFGIGWV